MTDQDRQAFEGYYRLYLAQFFEFPQQHIDHRLRMDSNGTYEELQTRTRYEGWKSARNHYALKLTEMKAMKIIEDIIWRQRPTIATDILAALRAAGLRFKEEA